MALTPGVELTGRYQLGRRLSDDGLVETWSATDQVLARAVEVEVLCPEAGPDGRAAFVASAGVLAKLAHAGIVSAYDRGESADGLPFLVTERAVGPTLADLTARHGALAPARIATIGAQLARALEAAHRAGTTHGSIGPAAVRVGSDDRAKLTGFTTGGVRSRIEGSAADPPADVRALARTLQAAGGTDTAPGPEPRGRRRGSGPGGSGPGGSGPGGSATLGEVLAAAASEERITPAAELAERLERLAADANPPPPAPAPPPTASPSPPPARRRSLRRAGAVAVAGVVVGLLLAVAIGVVAYVVFNRSPSSGPPSAATGSNATTLPPAPGSGLRIVAGHSFDPFGDGTELEALVPKVFDGNPSTVWTTEEYRTARFGGLKPGVGLYLILDRTHTLSTLTLSSPGAGWTFDVYVAAHSSPTLAGWGSPAAPGITVTGPTRVVALRGARGAAVLVWITDLGPPLPAPVDPTVPYRVTIGEIALH